MSWVGECPAGRQGPRDFFRVEQLLSTPTCLTPRMAATQLWLFLPPRPLVERLGREFFRTLPEKPGVYFLAGEQSGVLDVGKAKNLQKRLASYRVANPERLPRRLIRLLHQTRRIEFDLRRAPARVQSRRQGLAHTMIPAACHLCRATSRALLLNARALPNLACGVDRDDRRAWC